MTRNTENDFNVKNEGEWEDRVFLNADHFVTFRRLGVNKRERLQFSDFAQACLNAYGDPKALVYAVTKSGRQACLVKERWQHYLRLWKEQHNIVT